MATLDEQIEALTRRLDESERCPLVEAVAAAKGLPPGLAKRLLGSTRAELEADADVLLAMLHEAGGGDEDDDDDDEDFDPQKVADAIRGRRSLAEDDGDDDAFDPHKVAGRIRRGF